MTNFQYADLHCHPNLKTFGHSFDKKKGFKSDLWHTIEPSFYSQMVHQLTGITKFTQTDFTTMTRAKAKIVFVSLYPFEKGFFINKKVWPPLAARLADWGIEIGYERIRHLQQHRDYFTDLLAEYNFLLHSRQAQNVDGVMVKWALAKNREDLQRQAKEPNTISVILTIEGSHVFNTGLEEYGVQSDVAQVLENIRTLKCWDFPPFFIGLAHNFNNDLCGHARSLQRLGNLVNQDKNIDTGITEMGYAVVHALLTDTIGGRVYIDLKHMSLTARMQYYELLKTDYTSQNIPLIVSHGSVTGQTIGGDKTTSCPDIFNANDLNFFDEEILAIAASGGLLAIQMDIAVNADPKKLKGFLKDIQKETSIRKSARIIWNQLQHIAEVCDKAGYFAWGSTSVGSDFDGSIHPFPGILTATGLQPLAMELVFLANHFLVKKALSVPENRNITAEEIVERFMYTNIEVFLKKYFTGKLVKEQQSHFQTFE